MRTVSTLTCTMRRNAAIKFLGPWNHPFGSLRMPLCLSVVADDRDADGIGIGADALALNGGSILNTAGAEAVLDLGGRAVVNTADHKVDGGESDGIPTSLRLAQLWTGK